MDEAADHAIVLAPSLATAVDQLVAAKLVYRRTEGQDRRRVLIYLTARGRRLPARLADRLAGTSGRWATSWTMSMPSS
jgi:DNA-binding MarR family transcriptional regulator